MEELVEVIIRLISRFFEAPKTPVKPTPATQTRRVAAPVNLLGTPTSRDPSNRAVLRTNLPAARRTAGRRPAPTRIAVAEPILTAKLLGPAIASTGTAHAVPAKSIAATAAATAAAAAPKPRTPATAATLRRWLTPVTLQQQFIITEIFQPPLALRQPSDLH